MLAFKCDMPAQILEQAPQHEAYGFGVLDWLAVTDRQQNFGHLAGKAFVFHVFGPQSTG